MNKNSNKTISNINKECKIFIITIKIEIQNY